MGDACCEGFNRREVLGLAQRLLQLREFLVIVLALADVRDDRQEGRSRVVADDLYVFLDGIARAVLSPMLALESDGVADPVAQRLELLLVLARLQVHAEIARCELPQLVA